MTELQNDLFFSLFVIIICAGLIIVTKVRKKESGVIFAKLLMVVGAIELIYFLTTIWVTGIIGRVINLGNKITPDYLGHAIFLLVLLIVALISLSYGFWFSIKARNKQG
jgi:hypothetical protein